jgi:hypothetical protein
MVGDASAEGDGAGVLVLPSPCRSSGVRRGGHSATMAREKMFEEPIRTISNKKYWFVAFPMSFEVKISAAKTFG